MADKRSGRYLAVLSTRPRTPRPRRRMTLRPDFDAHKRDVGDVRGRGRVVHRPVLAARRGRFAIVRLTRMSEGKVAYGRLCDLCCKPACDRIKRSAGRDSDLCDVVSRPLQSACSPLAKALSKALQSESRFYCRFSKRSTPCKGEVKMVLSRGTRFQIFRPLENSSGAALKSSEPYLDTTWTVLKRRVPRNLGNETQKRLFS